MQDTFETIDISLDNTHSNLEEGVFLLPLSFTQQRMWFMEKLQPEKCLYNLSFPTCLEGLVNVHALERSFNTIIQRHETLRTTFTVVDGQPMQVVSQCQRIELPIIDLRQSSQVEQTAKVDELIKENAQQFFDLNAGPLLRVGLIQLEDTKSILLFTAHHIVFDGWSIGVFLRELEGFYDAFCNGKSFILPDLPIQYGDFAVWQRDRLQGKILESHASYWKEKLSGTLPILELPCDRIRPKIQTYAGAVKSFALPKSLSKALLDLAQQENSTLFMVLLTTFNILLHRYSGQEDLLVGTPIANRNQAEIEGLIGVFINTLVLRNNLSGNPTFRELLTQVRQTTLEAYTHQDFPFEKMIEELQLDRELGQSPLFQAMLVLQNQPIDDLKLTNLSLSPIEFENPISQFDLTLSLAETAQGLIGRLEYSTDLFDQSTIVRIIGHFQTLLEGIIANPDISISQIPLITKPECQQLIQDWSNSQCNLALPSNTINQLFESQVEKKPDSIAAIFNDQQLSYQQLNQRSNEVADYLKKIGLRPGVLVGIYLDRSLDMVAGILGILKAGGAYVPLDPSHPFERLQLILDDAQLRVVLTQTSLLPELKQNQEKTNRLLIDLHSLEEVVNCEVPLLAPSGSTLSSDLAYVIYTSGSTGKPKGVQITHHSVVNFLTSIQRQLNLSGDETFLAVTTIAFDISILEIFLPLTIGATLVLANSENAKNGVRLMEMLTRFEIDIMQATPTTWQMLLNSGWQGMPNFKALCGGEALSKELAVQLLKQGIDLWNMYGPTETTIWSTLCQIDQDFQTISIGRPIDNTEVYILDSHLNPVPIGVPGELLIGGHGLAKGYLNRPDLTAAKFIQHPFSPVPEARLYKTGDLVRYMPNGVIEYIGRNDSQVKIRGYRIELGEIEAVIQQYPAVEMAIVMVSEYAINDKRLVAYVVINKLDETLPEQDLVWEDQLQIYLKEKLPSYMVPTDWAILDALPLTPNGKINRKLLPKVNDLRPRNGKKQELPKTDLEKSIVDIWEKALKRAQISVQDNFFDLGGHSLLVIQVHDSLSKDLNVDVDLLDLFKYPTVQTLANYLSNKPSKLLQVSAGNERAKKRQAARHKRKQLKAQTNN